MKLSKLNYEGADSDLIIALIETIYNIPALTNPNMQREECIVGYINISIKNKYVYYSKKYSNIAKTEIELNTDIAGVPINETLENKLFARMLLDKLPMLQRKVLVELFFKDRSVSEIANELNISRQAVNKTKNKALSSLRKGYIM